MFCKHFDTHLRNAGLLDWWHLANQIKSSLRWPLLSLPLAFMAGNEVQVVVSATPADEVVETTDVQFEGDIWVYSNGEAVA